MVAAPPAEPVNIRGIGILGPPPPYRPIIQGGPVFERGPPPDLEPWRLASLTRIPADPQPNARAAEAGVVSAEEPWALEREPDRPIQEEAAASYTGRYEIEDPAGPSISPADGPALGYAPWGPAPASTARTKRRVVWLVGLVVAVLGMAIALDTARAPLIREFPAAARVYATFGLADH